MVQPSHVLLVDIAPSHGAPTFTRPHDAGGVHSERLQEPLLDLLLPRSTCRALDNPPGHQQIAVGLRPATSVAVEKIQFTGQREEIVARPGCVGRKGGVGPVVRQSRGVAQELVDGKKKTEEDSLG